jgi:N-acetylneuraminic acid mutarotase
MPPSLTKVNSYLSAIVDGKIYIIFSWNEAYNAYTDKYTFSSSNQIYDSETGTWKFGKPLPTPVVLASAGATTGTLAPKRVYVIGGCPAWSGPDFYHGINTTQVYNIENDTWIVGADMPTRRRDLAVTVVNDTLYAMGGISGDTSLATVEQYIPIGYKTPLPPLPNETSENAHTIPSTLLITVAIAILVAASLVILVYFKKIKH